MKICMQVFIIVLFTIAKNLETGEWTKKEQTISTCNNIDGPQILYAQWKKPDTKDNILYDFINMKFLEQG